MSSCNPLYSIKYIFSYLLFCPDICFVFKRVSKSFFFYLFMFGKRGRLLKVGLNTLVESKNLNIHRHELYSYRVNKMSVLYNSHIDDKTQNFFSFKLISTYCFLIKFKNFIKIHNKQ